MQHDYHFAITSLPEYLDAQPTDGLPTWCGELRSGARANVLMGVASNRVDVHQAAAAAERALERRAEPLSALFVPAAAYPARAARPRLAQPGAEQRARLVVRVQSRRSGRGGAGALPGGAPHRRGARPTTRSPPLAGEIDAPAGVDRGREPVGRRSHRHGRARRCPAPGPVHLVAVDDGTALPTQVVRHARGRGLLHRRDRPEDPLGARDDARARSSRAPASPGSSDHRRDDGVTEYMFHDAAPGEPADRSRGAPARRCSRSARPARRSPSASSARRCRTSCSRPDRCRASGGARSVWSTARGRARACPRTETCSRTSTCAWRSIPPTARSPSTPTACTSPKPTA